MSETIPLQIEDKSPVGDPYIRALVTGAQHAMAQEGEEAEREAHAKFHELVQLTFPDTYTLAKRLTGDDEDAADVAQETYLRAYRALPKFRGDAQFTTWLYRITANEASTHMGRRSRHRHEELNEDQNDKLPFNAELPEKAENSELRKAVSEALQFLPSKLRSVVVLRDIYDFSHEMIAEELGISESAAKVRLHRARRRLRDSVFLKAAYDGHVSSEK